MKRISQGSTRKRKKKNGKWEWQALLVITEGSRKRQLTKYTGIARTRLTEAERGSGRRVVPSGKAMPLDKSPWQSRIPNPALCRQAAKESATVLN